eukprot:SAG31_NODE_562_length_14085_cov_164.582869_8_plen_96_part_00
MPEPGATADVTNMIKSANVQLERQVAAATAAGEPPAQTLELLAMHEEAIAIQRDELARQRGENLARVQVRLAAQKEMARAELEAARKVTQHHALF